MNNVPRREKVRKGFTSPKGIAFLASVAKTPTSESTTAYHNEGGANKNLTPNTIKTSKGK